MLQTLLLVIHVLLAIALVVTILLQKSEGGVLGVGGGPTGLMSARGAADFLTRTTTILATAFIATSIGLAFIAGANRQASSDVTDLLEGKPAPVAPALPGAPIAGSAPAPAATSLPGAPVSGGGTATEPGAATGGALPDLPGLGTAPAASEAPAAPPSGN